MRISDWSSDVCSSDLAPFANENQAKAANGGAAPPDLSLMIKARVGGPDYTYGILTGYHEPPEGFEMQPGLNYNAVFPGHQIAMPQPLSEDAVEYADGTPATVEQMSHDEIGRAACRERVCQYV